MNAMFSQLDDGKSYRRPRGRELFPAGDPRPPLTVKDFAAFDAIGEPDTGPEPDAPDDGRRVHRTRIITSPRRPRIDWSQVTVKELQTTYPDVIAARLGCPAALVLNFRIRRGIKLLLPRRPKTKLLYDWSLVTEEDLANTYPEIIAAQVGCTTAAVTAKMRKLGIRSTLKKRAKGTVKPPAPL